MAAAGGDTVVPTNWVGLITISIIIAVVALVTYFGMEYQFGHQGPEKKTEETTSVQEVFSASARREVASAGAAQVLSRAELAANQGNGTDASASGSTADLNSDDDDSWDNVSNANDASGNDDWANDSSDDGNNNAGNDANNDASNDDWDTTTDNWDTEVSDKLDSASESASKAAAAAADAAKKAADKIAASAKQAAADAKAAAASAAAKLRASADSSNAPVVAAPSKPAPASGSASTASKPAASTTRQRPDSAALRDWWSEAAGDLSVRFAGTLDRGDRVSDGIAVMFSETVAASQGNQHMSLVDASGNKVSLGWKSAANPTMLIMVGLKPGKYTLSIDDSLISQNGKNLSRTASGPVFVY